MSGPTGEIVSVDGAPLVDLAATADAACAALDRHLNQLGAVMADNTGRAYRRQAAAYTAWLSEHAEHHPNAFTEQISAYRAVTAWRHDQADTGLSLSSINQALTAIKLLYQVATHLDVTVQPTAAVEPTQLSGPVSGPANAPAHGRGAIEALTRIEEAKVRQAADRRGRRDAAIVAVLLDTGARTAECARLHVADLHLTVHAAVAHLVGQQGQARQLPLPAPARQRLTTWLHTRAQLLADRPTQAVTAAAADNALWIGRRGVLSVDGISEVVRVVGVDAGLPRLRPLHLRHTYATRLHEGGADPAHIHSLLGHASITTGPPSPQRSSS